MIDVLAVVFVTAIGLLTLACLLFPNSIRAYGVTFGPMNFILRTSVRIESDSWRLL